ncbi:hypothetical protein IPL85_00815 [Candidatus Saccharibacteria bacterium]|nr:MAG: hypothetical protein IPL85_00815 [Candidatus Saccharibacteria bacterium]
MINNRLTWYNLLPWWVLIIAVFAIGLAGSIITENFKGPWIDTANTALGLLAIYCLLAIFVKVLVSTYAYFTKLIPRKKKIVRNDSEDLLDFRK